MKWQDIVIAICQIFLVLALLPSIRSHHKPPTSTSTMNFVIISTITVCLLTLKLWLAAITAAMIALTWLFLAYQKHQIEKKK